MKSFIFLATILFASLSFASGKFIFEPSKDLKNDEQQIMMGLSVYQKFFGPLYFTNFTGVIMDVTETKSSDPSNAMFNLGLGLQPLDKLQFEGGVKLSRDLETKYTEQIAYLKISAQLW